VRGVESRQGGDFGGPEGDTLSLEPAVIEISEKRMYLIKRQTGGNYRGAKKSEKKRRLIR